ncbi:hypothetical protein CQA49_00880 [Helicobacter sp. MIT 00-7814]|uniref:hypothetical protein n=1 Tax=unclassified Helicobacter TaxID=2593540 RepID=UPI000E1F9337|nr:MULTISPECIES: hypothetical protein [unclassified Helicobacter]RDU55067.1 hypothetical protein CQA37_04470 [Helicobacter sp. MIT 99-10781]RDU56886.1 hypothetical protein CQA49_00880 [Helicobacter sp. MIT 00-7814]
MRVVILCLALLSLGYCNPSNFKAQLNQDFAFIQQNIGGDSLLIEATYYEIGDPENGIEPDLLRSLKAYGKLYQSKNPVASYKLGMLAWMYQENKNSVEKNIINELKKIDGLNPEKYLKNGSEWNKEVRYEEISNLNRIAYGIYLFSQNKYNESIKVLNSQYVSERSLAQLYIAFNYLQLKRTDLADFYLNKACNNPQIDNSVFEFCANSASLNRENIDW